MTNNMRTEEPLQAEACKQYLDRVMRDRCKQVIEIDQYPRSLVLYASCPVFLWVNAPPGRSGTVNLRRAKYWKFLKTLAERGVGHRGTYGKVVFEFADLKSSTVNGALQAPGRDLILELQISRRRALWWRIKRKLGRYQTP